MSNLPELPHREPGATVPSEELRKKPPARHLGRVIITPDGVMATPISNDDDEALTQLLDALRRWEPTHV